MGLLKEAIEYYKTQKRIEKSKKALLNSKTDFALLELFIQRCNNNPGLKIKVTTNDGAVYELQTFDEKKKMFSVGEHINGQADSIDEAIKEFIQ